MKMEKKLPLKKFIPAILWFLTILILLILPGSTFPKAPGLDLIEFDKLVHTGLFCVLVLLWFRPFTQEIATGSGRRRLLLYLATTALLYGTAMEFVQKYWIPNRSFDVFDILADGVGSFLPLIFFKRVNKWVK